MVKIRTRFKVKMGPFQYSSRISVSVRLFQGQVEKGQDDCQCQDENLEQSQVQNEINTGS